MKPVAFALRLLLLVVMLGACHQGPAPRANIGPNAGQSIGDTAAFGERLLNIDARGPSVTFQVTAPAQVLLVSITPGVSAVPIGALTSDTTLAAPGIHTMKFVPEPRASSPAPSVASWGSLDQTDYDRCVRARTRGLVKKRVVRTDSTGKTSVEMTNEPDDPQQEVDVERRCEANVNNRLKSHTSARPRFLVLMASNTPLMLSEAIQRFETMRSIPIDVTLAVNAVASTLYGDRRGTWSANYIAW
jgi:hypothetical protein